MPKTALWFSNGMMSFIIQRTLSKGRSFSYIVSALLGCIVFGKRGEITPFSKMSADTCGRV